LLQVRQSKKEEETPMNERAIDAYILVLFLFCMGIAAIGCLLDNVWALQWVRPVSP
jgi:hypothetical protein